MINNKYFFAIVHLVLIPVLQVNAAAPIFVYDEGNGGLESQSIGEWISKANASYEASYNACVAELNGSGLEPRHYCTKNKITGTYTTSDVTYVNGVEVHQGVTAESEKNGLISKSKGRVMVSFKCDRGYIEAISPITDNSLKVTCNGYKALQLKDIEPQSCDVPQSVGNPILLSSGDKIQRESIEFQGATIENIYRSNRLGVTGANPWQQRPDRLLRGEKTLFVDSSKAYPTREEACNSGFLEIQSRAPVNSWIRGVTAEYNNQGVPVGCNSCLLKKNGKVVSALAIVDGEEKGNSVNGNDVLQHLHADGATTNYFRECSSGLYKPFGFGVNNSLGIQAGETIELSSSAGKKVFDANGQLMSAYNGAGHVINRYSYMGESLSILNQYGQAFIYEYSGDLLKSVRAPDGNLLQFAYQNNNLLNKIVYPDHSTRIYHYEDARFSGALTGMTDERGVRFATWKYDETGRAISSEHAGGAEKTTLAFNADGSTTVTNALGKKTTYRFTDILGVRRVTNVSGEPTASCVGANQAYTYTPQGQVETKTDWNGSITRFTYDSSGRELTKTQAYGTADAKTVQTCWHETLNQPSRIIEPAKITLFDYTATGQLKSQILIPRPAGSLDCLTAL